MTASTTAGFRREPAVNESVPPHLGDQAAPSPGPTPHLLSHAPPHLLSLHTFCPPPPHLDPWFVRPRAPMRCVRSRQSILPPPLWGSASCPNPVPGCDCARHSAEEGGGRGEKEGNGGPEAGGGCLGTCKICVPGHEAGGERGRFFMEAAYG